MSKMNASKLDKKTSLKNGLKKKKSLHRKEFHSEYSEDSNGNIK